ncbi:MAG: polysaccharide biosynthesis protein, partial [Phycisphaerales bacterium]
MSIPETQPESRQLLVGGQRACERLIRQLRAIDEAAAIVGVVTTEPTETTSIADTPVLGSIEELVANCASNTITSAIVTLPASERALWRTISVSLHRAGVIERFVPPIDELLHSAPTLTAPSTVTIGAPKIDLAKLVGREPHEIDRELVSGSLNRKTVLVTGAGGSIGSELVRQVASYHPSRIVLMERAENALFEVDR